MVLLYEKNIKRSHIWPQSAAIDQSEPSKPKASYSKFRPILGGRGGISLCLQTKALLQSFMMTKYFLYKVLIRFGHKLCALSSMKVFIFQF